MKYWKQGFYDAPIDGAVEITEERWHELLDGQAAGMMITENEQGVPILTECVDDTPAPTYEQQVQSLIWERYSIADELAILRQRDTKPDEFAAYFEYAEQCKLQVKKLIGNERTYTTPDVHGSRAGCDESCTIRRRSRLRVRYKPS